MYFIWNISISIGTFYSISMFVCKFSPNYESNQPPEAIFSFKTRIIKCIVNTPINWVIRLLLIHTLTWAVLIDIKLNLYYLLKKNKCIFVPFTVTLRTKYVYSTVQYWTSGYNAYFHTVRTKIAYGDQNYFNSLAYSAT